MFARNDRQLGAHLLEATSSSTAYGLLVCHEDDSPGLQRHSILTVFYTVPPVSSQSSSETPPLIPTQILFPEGSYLLTNSPRGPLQPHSFSYLKTPNLSYLHSQSQFCLRVHMNITYITFIVALISNQYINVIYPRSKQGAGEMTQWPQAFVLAEYPSLFPRINMEVHKCTKFQFQGIRHHFGPLWGPGCIWCTNVDPGTHICT